MLDATGHGANCAYAADPRAKCDCGGRQKQRMNIKPADMGLEPPPGAISNALNRPINTIGQQLSANKDQAIKKCADEAFGEGQWNHYGIGASKMPSGVEQYTYQGKPFMEWLGVEFVALPDDNGTITTTVTQRYRKLELS